MSAAEENVIEVRGLDTWLNGRYIHRGLDLSTRRGEVMTVVGASGSGKSMLLQQIIGLMEPTAGQIEVLGTNVHAADEETARRLRQRWGVLFQRGALFSAFTVFDNIAFPLRELNRYGHRLTPSMIADIVWSKLTMVGLEPADAWKMPAELSGGMMKRAALARALVLEAELLFLDEPDTGLDPVLSRELNELIRHVHAEQNLSGLVISHDLETIATLSDRVAILDDGRIAAVGTLEEITEVDHPFATRLFASSDAQQRLHRAMRSE